MVILVAVLKPSDIPAVSCVMFSQGSVPRCDAAMRRYGDLGLAMLAVAHEAHGLQDLLLEPTEARSNFKQ